MSRSCLYLLVLVPVMAWAGPTPIHPIHSWAEYRERLVADGATESAADADVAEALASLRAMDRDAGADRIGVEAPPFAFDGWLNSEPVTLESLRGQVVVVRWWTDTCPFCASSAPALRRLHEEYGGRGVTLVGVFHPKAGRNDPLDVARVQRAVDARDFAFPVAIDWDWRNGTLARWWLTGPDRPATSVTFVLDRDGVVRFIHPGMEYHDAGDWPEPGRHDMCAADMASIRAAIDRLLEGGA